jgi:arylsulfatase A-like enzyme
MQESTYAQRVPENHLPEDAPNILIVLIDDAGPGLPSTFGGEVTPCALTGPDYDRPGAGRLTLPNVGEALRIALRV